MIETLYLPLITIFSSFFGSINCLGITSLLGIGISFLPADAKINYIVQPYFASLILSCIFIMTRPKIFFQNFVTIALLSLASGIGLFSGKIIKTNMNIGDFKLLIGIVLIFTAILLKSLKKLDKSVEQIYDPILKLFFFDYILFFIIGLLAGVFDFGIIAFIYIFVLAKDFYVKFESIDVCIYSVLAVTSLINLTFLAIKIDLRNVETVSSNFLWGLLIGAIAARIIYSLISLDLRKKLILAGILLIGTREILISIL